MDRIYHPWDRWECFSAGFYDTSPPSGLSADQCRESYAVFLKDIARFEVALNRVITEWPISSEQFLSNENINRIAWLGQASMCIDSGVPSVFRGGFKLLSNEQQKLANACALKWLNIWIRRRCDAKQSKEISEPVAQAGLF